MPATDSGKAIASRNATTHGLFARDVVLPSLGEDPDGYRQMETQWTTQIVPRNLLERHYVEKIAAASWRLRRLHRWQAQLFEDDTLTEAERLDRLDKVLRHETALHRQIDTAVKMLAKDVPQLYTRRVRDQVLEDAHVSERECRDDAEDDVCIDLETRNRLYRIRKATEQAMNELSQAPLDTADDSLRHPCSLEVDQQENCQNELAPPKVPSVEAANSALVAAPAVFLERGKREPGQCDAEQVDAENCRNEPVAFHTNPPQVTERLDLNYRLRVPAVPARTGKSRRLRRG